jgi:hypothetical protein
LEDLVDLLYFGLSFLLLKLIITGIYFTFQLGKSSHSQQQWPHPYHHLLWIALVGLLRSKLIGFPTIAIT